MTISKKQLKANRQNAKKSTGPKTEAGKAIAARNALKHGLYSNQLILNSSHLKENKIEFLLMLQSLRDELAPRTVSEDYLVQKIAACYWRSRRVIAAETAHINKQLNDLDKDWKYQQLVKQLVNSAVDSDPLDDESFNEYVENHLERNVIVNDRFSKFIQVTELRLDRQLGRAYRLLRQLRQLQRDNQKDEKKQKKESL